MGCTVLILQCFPSSPPSSEIRVRDVSSFQRTSARVYTYRHNLTHRIIHHFPCIRLPRATLEITFLYIQCEKKATLSPSASIHFAGEMKTRKDGKRGWSQATKDICSSGNGTYVSGRFSSISRFNRITVFK